MQDELSARQPAIRLRLAGETIQMILSKTRRPAMAICQIYNTNGQEVGKVEYKSFPPDTEATVYSNSSRPIGSVKSQHAERRADIFDSTGKIAGRTDGFAPYGERECWVENSANQTIGLVKNGSEVSKRVGKEFSFTMVGTVRSDVWTDADKAGLKFAAETMGRSADRFLENLIQIKQRSLAGVAALLLNQL